MCLTFEEDALTLARANFTINTRDTELPRFTGSQPIRAELTGSVLADHRTEFRNAVLWAELDGMTA